MTSLAEAPGTETCTGVWELATYALEAVIVPVITKGMRFVMATYTYRQAFATVSLRLDK